MGSPFTREVCAGEETEKFVLTPRGDQLYSIVCRRKTWFDGWVTQMWKFGKKRPRPMH